MTVLVTNAGTHPEPAQIAAAFAEIGENVHYLSTLSWSSGGAVAALAGADNRVSRIIRQRLLPNALSVSSCHNLAVPVAVSAEIVLRLRPQHGRLWLERRNRRFSKKAASIVKIVEPSVLVAQQTNAKLVFEAAPSGTVRVLNYPIAHHRELFRLMGEERKRWPKWMDMTQGSSASEETLCRLDREVDLADKVIVASSFSKRSFQNAGVEESKMICIPLGVDATQFDQSPRETESKWIRAGRGSEFHLLFVGQANQRKGFIDLVDAMSRVCSRKLKLTVVGVASSTARAVANFYDQDVRFVGPQPKALLGNYYRSADLFVLPSVVEGFGLSALEAMVAGTPVLVSDHTFGPDLIESGRNGLVANSRDPQELAKVLAMAAASDAASLKELAVRGAETARTYTWAAYRRNVCKSLSGLVSEE